MWLGLEYMFWVQRNHGKSGTKLVSYIAADRMNYQYVQYDKFQIAGWKEQYQIKSVGRSLNSFNSYTHSSLLMEQKDFKNVLHY